MPHIDRHSGEIVIRIVYDGMPEAGKTTNIHQLFAAVPLQRRGDLASPDTTGRRTEFFDWLDFAGGFVDGRRVRCQLVSVPGQPQLLHRRKYLLATADVVVFVADSRPETVAENRESVTTLLGMLRDFHPTLSAPIVIQANKQDLPGAMRSRVLSAELDVPLATPVVPAVAHAGRGVMDTFVLAARLASDRVRALVVGGTSLEAIADDQVSARSLHGALLMLEERAAPRRTVTHSEVRSLVRSRANDVAAARACALPRPESLLAGHVWPPVKGRAAVAAAMTGDVEIPEHAADWAPEGAVEIGLEGWTLHSCAGWLHPDEAGARSALLVAARALLAEIDLVPEGRALLVAPDGDAFRLWMLTPPLEPLASRLLASLVDRDVAGAAGVLADLARARAAIADVRGEAVVPAGASGVAMQSGRAVVLALGAGGARLDEHAVTLAEQATAEDPEARAAFVAARASQGGRR
ncbi:MAG: hypothetical protein KIT84_16660 [Labilithrix sp.]|nr:hypothetical protein [Labilithrix sp.]MCW5812663.1 hypothetical protein [Labilithrix sp.]